MSGRVVVVTGGTAGVGRATARAFADDGDAVAVLARGAEGLEGARRDLEARGAQAWTGAVDVADAAAVEAAASEIEAELGPIDVWVNNAMVSVLAPVADLDAADVRRVTEVTYLGAVHGTLAALRRMRRRDRGVIVQVGSTLAHRAIPLQAPYCAAKHALRGFTDALRTELLHDRSNVAVTMVQLPGLNTPQFDWVKTCLRRHPRPVAPVYEPETAARAVLWAAEHPRPEVFVGGRTAASVWAARLAPRLVDRYLARTSFSAQQDDTTIEPHRRDNLWCPVPEDHGARGRFSGEAHEHMPAFWVTRHRRLVAGAGALAVTAALARRFGRSS